MSNNATNTPPGGSMSNDAVIRAEAVGKNYRVGSSIIEAVSGFGLAVSPGEFVALMGPSGCGKT